MPPSSPSPSPRATPRFGVRAFVDAIAADTPLPGVAGDLLNSRDYGRPDEPDLLSTATGRRDPATATSAD